MRSVSSGCKAPSGYENRRSDSRSAPHARQRDQSALLRNNRARRATRAAGRRVHCALGACHASRVFADVTSPPASAKRATPASSPTAPAACPGRSSSSARGSANVRAAGSSTAYVARRPPIEFDSDTVIRELLDQFEQTIEDLALLSTDADSDPVKLGAITRRLEVVERRIMVLGSLGLLPRDWARFVEAQADRQVPSASTTPSRAAQTCRAT
jgi:hypothetical protein